jgi:hypothetical protein
MRASSCWSSKDGKCATTKSASGRSLRTSWLATPPVDWFEHAVSKPRGLVSPAVAQRVAERALEVPPPKRAERAIKLAQGVVVGRTIQD